jgi:hypothetical protein
LTSFLNNDKILQETSKARLYEAKKVKVSRYPRANLPLELKSRFEVDMGEGKSPPNNISERKGSIASTTYNDEFWRQKTE